MKLLALSQLPERLTLGQVYHIKSITLADGLVVNTAVASTVVVALAGTITMLFKLLMDAKNKQITELEAVNKSYREIADEAVKSAQDTLTFYRQKEGKSAVVPLAHVLPEANSPSTPAKRVDADIANMRQKLAQIKLAAGQSPREEPERAGLSYVDEPAKGIGSIPSGLISVIKTEIAQVPEKTADKVVEKIAEAKQEQPDPPA